MIVLPLLILCLPLHYHAPLKALETQTTPSYQEVGPLNPELEESLPLTFLPPTLPGRKVKKSLKVKSGIIRKRSVHKRKKTNQDSEGSDDYDPDTDEYSEIEEMEKGECVEGHVSKETAASNTDVSKKISRKAPNTTKSITHAHCNIDNKSGTHNNEEDAEIETTSKSKFVILKEETTIATISSQNRIKCDKSTINEDMPGESTTQYIEFDDIQPDEPTVLRETEKGKKCSKNKSDADSTEELTTQSEERYDETEAAVPNNEHTCNKNKSNFEISGEVKIQNDENDVMLTTRTKKYDKNRSAPTSGEVTGEMGETTEEDTSLDIKLKITECPANDLVITGEVTAPADTGKPISIDLPEELLSTPPVVSDLVGTCTLKNTLRGKYSTEPYSKATYPEVEDVTESNRFKKKCKSTVSFSTNLLSDELSSPSEEDEGSFETATCTSEEQPISDLEESTKILLASTCSKKTLLDNSEEITSLSEFTTILDQTTPESTTELTETPESQELICTLTGLAEVPTAPDIQDETTEPDISTSPDLATETCTTVDSIDPKDLTTPIVGLNSFTCTNMASGQSTTRDVIKFADELQTADLVESTQLKITGEVAIESTPLKQTTENSDFESSESNNDKESLKQETCERNVGDLYTSETSLSENYIEKPQEQKTEDEEPKAENKADGQSSLDLEVGKTDLKSDDQTIEGSKMCDINKADSKTVEENSKPTGDNSKQTDENSKQTDENSKQTDIEAKPASKLEPENDLQTQIKIGELSKQCDLEAIDFKQDSGHFVERATELSEDELGKLIQQAADESKDAAPVQAPLLSDELPCVEDLTLADIEDTGLAVAPMIDTSGNVDSILDNNMTELDIPSQEVVIPKIEDLSGIENAGNESETGNFSNKEEENTTRKGEEGETGMCTKEVEEEEATGTEPEEGEESTTENGNEEGEESTTESGPGKGEETTAESGAEEGEESTTVPGSEEGDESTTRTESEDGEEPTTETGSEEGEESTTGSPAEESDEESTAVTGSEEGGESTKEIGEEEETSTGSDSREETEAGTEEGEQSTVAKEIGTGEHPEETTDKSEETSGEETTEYESTEPNPSEENAEGNENESSKKEPSNEESISMCTMANKISQTSLNDESTEGKTSGDQEQDYENKEVEPNKLEDVEDNTEKTGTDKDKSLEAMNEQSEEMSSDEEIISVPNYDESETHVSEHKHKSNHNNHKKTHHPLSKSNNHDRLNQHKNQNGHSPNPKFTDVIRPHKKNKHKDSVDDLEEQLEELVENVMVLQEIMRDRRKKMSNIHKHSAKLQKKLAERERFKKKRSKKKKDNTELTNEDIDIFEENYHRLRGNGINKESHNGNKPSHKHKRYKHKRLRQNDHKHKGKTTKIPHSRLKAKLKLKQMMKNKHKHKGNATKMSQNQLKNKLKLKQMVKNKHKHKGNATKVPASRLKAKLKLKQMLKERNKNKKKGHGKDKANKISDKEFGEIKKTFEEAEREDLKEIEDKIREKINEYKNEEKEATEEVTKKSEESKIKSKKVKDKKRKSETVKKQMGGTKKKTRNIEGAIHETSGETLEEGLAAWAEEAMKRSDDYERSDDYDNSDEYEISEQSDRPGESEESVKSEGSYKSVKFANSEKLDKPERFGKSERFDKTEISGETERSDEPERSDNTKRFDESDRSSDSKKFNESERSDETEKLHEYERSDEPERSDKTERSDETEKFSDSQKSDESERSDEPERSDNGQRSGETERSSDSKIFDESERSDESQKLHEYENDDDEDENEDDEEVQNKEVKRSENKNDNRKLNQIKDKISGANIDNGVSNRLAEEESRIYTIVDNGDDSYNSNTVENVRNVDNGEDSYNSNTAENMRNNDKVEYRRNVDNAENDDTVHRRSFDTGENRRSVDSIEHRRNADSVEYRRNVDSDDQKQNVDTGEENNNNGTAENRWNIERRRDIENRKNVDTSENSRNVDINERRHIVDKNEAKRNVNDGCINQKVIGTYPDFITYVNVGNIGNLRKENFNPKVLYAVRKYPIGYGENTNNYKSMDNNNGQIKNSLVTGNGIRSGDGTIVSSNRIEQSNMHLPGETDNINLPRETDNMHLRGEVLTNSGTKQLARAIDKHELNTIERNRLENASRKKSMKIDSFQSKGAELIPIELRNNAIANERVIKKVNNQPDKYEDNFIEIRENPNKVSMVPGIHSNIDNAKIKVDGFNQLNSFNDNHGGKVNNIKHDDKISNVDFNRRGILNKRDKDTSEYDTEDEDETTDIILKRNGQLANENQLKVIKKLKQSRLALLKERLRAMRSRKDIQNPEEADESESQDSEDVDDNESRDSDGESRVNDGESRVNDDDSRFSNNEDVGSESRTNESKDSDRESKAGKSRLSKSRFSEKRSQYRVDGNEDDDDVEFDAGDRQARVEDEESAVDNKEIDDTAYNDDHKKFRFGVKKLRVDDEDSEAGDDRELNLRYRELGNYGNNEYEKNSGEIYVGQENKNDEVGGGKDSSKCKGPQYHPELLSDGNLYLPRTTEKLDNNYYKKKNKLIDLEIKAKMLEITARKLQIRKYKKAIKS